MKIAGRERKRGGAPKTDGRAMTILAIETSCDETAISIVEASGGIKKPRFKVFTSITLSQQKLHAHYGGVFPMLAKREHAKSLVPILKEALAEADMLKKNASPFLSEDKRLKLKAILEREPELCEQFLNFIPSIKKPKIDILAVTHGPGLEPALWVGINFAKALAFIWDLPVIPVNHMEGHVAVALACLRRDTRRRRQATKKKSRGQAAVYAIENIRFPTLALLVSGGHTELVLSKPIHDRSAKGWNYQIIGETRDDAAGEAFDKVARILGLPYPGGPQISALAERARAYTEKRRGDAKNVLREFASSTHGFPFALPRPMIRTEELDFSFSGLKTAVLYAVKKLPALTEELRALMAQEFEEAVADVLTRKTISAAQRYRIKTVILGGGVSANTHIRHRLLDTFKKEFPKVSVLMPDPKLSTDNALMIALAAYLRIATNHQLTKRGVSPEKIIARGNLRIA